MDKTITLHPNNSNREIYSRDVVISSNSILRFKKDSDTVRSYGLDIDGTTFFYCTPASRQADFELAVRAKSGGWNMLDGIRKYVDSNRDLIYTVAFVAIIDQLLFEGAFRERLKALIEGFLKKAEAQNAAV